MSHPPYSGQPPMEPLQPQPPYGQPSPLEPPYGQQPPPMEPQFGHPPYPGQPAPGFPPQGGYPVPPPADNKRTLLIVGGIAAAVVVLLLVTVGAVLALSGDDNKPTPTAGGSSSAPTDEQSEPEPDDEPSPSEDEDDDGGGTHKPVEHMCEKLDGAPLQAFYDTLYGKPSESLRDVGDTAVATCVTSLTKGSNRRQHAMIACSGYYHPDAAEASRFFEYQHKAAVDTLAKGPVEELSDLGEKAIIYPTSTSTSLQSLVVLILDDNLVLQARIMASHASGSWTPATAAQLKQAVIAAAKATLPKVTGG